MKKKLIGYTKNQLVDLAKEKGFPGFVGGQMADWLYKKNIFSIEEMTNLSKKNRDILSGEYIIGREKHANVEESRDGTKKYLFPARDNKFIESAYIPEEDRSTLCVSSQVGCKMSCFFCMTGMMGFQGNLDAGEIVNQVLALPEKEKLTNIVYMGMGEPFDNTSEVLKSLEILTSDWGLGMSPSRITVSTIGLIPGLKRFLEESKCHLAISLHSPFNEERQRIMPVQRTYPVQDVLKIIRHADIGRQRKVSFEYILFKDLNDTARHVNELARLLNGIRCRINLIRFHTFRESTFQGSSEQAIQEFARKLNDKGITTTIRKSRGQDISAACGMLSLQKSNLRVI